MSGHIFQRHEEKYLLELGQYYRLMASVREHMQVDEYGDSTIGSIYFDTPDYRLIRHSLSKPAYKEKLRVRCYGTPKSGDRVFVELKKKYDAIVYKRRISAPLEEVEARLRAGGTPGDDSQIGREISWLFRLYPSLSPAMYIGYRRIAMQGRQDPRLRMTFDRDVCYRTRPLDLRKGLWGSRLLQNGQWLLEIKVPGAMPLWLVKVLGQLNVYPASFSKYGRAYLALQMERTAQNDSVKGERIHA